jgi:uncharacterized protein with NAD-binding domain and iron-sulfur cluster
VVRDKARDQEQSISMANPKQKIAVLGGGVGSLATVYLLTNEPGWQDRYEITVYQMGWRLGGKGACGRNAALADRIEEHGPHVWFGFYQTAFQVLKGCYDYCRQNNLTPESPFQQCIPDAMRPKNDSTVMELAGGQWKPWHITLPAHEGLPYDPPVGLTAQLVRLVEWMIGIHDGLSRASGVKAHTVTQAGLAARALDRIHRLAVRAAAPPERQTILQRILEVIERLQSDLAGADTLWHRALEWLGGKVISRLLRSFLELVERDAKPLIDANDDIRRAWLLLDLAVAHLRGIFDDGILRRGFDVINGQDYSAWLGAHGCRNPWSPIVQGLYDTCFAFDKGATGRDGETRPASASMEAGSTLRGVLQLFFGYNGSYCYKMQSGMGDTIFTPLYLTLQHRGVKFRFFHQVTNLGVKGSAIDSIELNVQAAVRPQDGLEAEYRPLKNVKGLLCWPNEPFYEQLVEGDQLRAVNLESCWSGWKGRDATLRRGQDFDCVVLGISIGMLPSICKDLISTSQAWRDMIANIKTTQTQSFQIWLNKTAEELGWAVDAAAPGTAAARQFELMSGYTQPIDSWADMSQVLPTERWGDAAKSVHYIFGPLEDAADIPPPWTRSDFPATQTERAKTQMRDFLSRDVAALFPKGVHSGDPPCLDWNLLVDLGGHAGAQRLDSQYWRANVEPSERYVLSLEGSGRYRVEPGKSGFDNLILAGDWTKNGFDVGCVEAAALSAKLAATAIADSAAQAGGSGT